MNCVICRKAFDDNRSPTVVTRGVKTLLEFSQKHGHTDLYDYLTSEPPTILVHSDCRLSYTSKKRLDQDCRNVYGDSLDESQSTSKRLRSSVSTFNFKDHCFFCGEPLIAVTLKKMIVERLGRI